MTVLDLMKVLNTRVSVIFEDKNNKEIDHWYCGLKEEYTNTEYFKNNFLHKTIIGIYQSYRGLVIVIDNKKY